MIFAGRKARRYARAVYALASEQGQQADLVAALLGVRAQFEQQPRLGQVLEHRRIGVERKLDLVAKFTEPGLARDLVTLLVRNGRVALLPEVAQALSDMLDLEQGVVRAHVTTAVPLLRAERDMIAEKLRSHLGAQRVEVDVKVSKRVVAGVLIHVGDQVIDATVRTYLDTMRERLKQIKVGEFADRGFLQAGLDGLAAGGGD